MPEFFNQVILTWRDVNGKEATAFLSTQDQTSTGTATYLPLVAAFEACADAKIICVQFQTTLRRTVTPLSGPYCTVWDRGVGFDRNPTSQRWQRQAIVGPKADIFLPDTVTMNLADARVIALQAQIAALLGDSNGNACGAFTRGKRQKASGS